MFCVCMCYVNYKYCMFLFFVLGCGGIVWSLFKIDLFSFDIYVVFFFVD